MVRVRRSPVQSLKHIIDTSGVISDVPSFNDLVNTVDAPAMLTNPADCHNGSKVFNIFLKVEVKGTIAFGGVPRVYFLILKNPTLAGSVDPSNMGISVLRKFVIHQEMMMVTRQATSGAGGDWGFPRTMFAGVVRIPKGYQRMGIGDKLQLVIQTNLGEATGRAEFCLQCIYKEFY